MNKRILWQGLGLIGVLAIGQMGCGGVEDEAAALPAENSRLMNVAVYALKADTLQQYSRLPATAKPWREVDLNFLEGGVVAQVLYDMGDRVGAKENLAFLDTELLQAAAIEAEAGFKFQHYHFEHSKELHAEGSVSENELYTAEYNLKRAESTLKAISVRLDKSILQAPFAGQVAQCTIKPGQLVQPGSKAMRLVQIDSMKVEIWVPENQIADFVLHRPVEIRFEAYPERSFKGVVGRIGPEADSSRRVFPMEVHMANPAGHIRPGMIGRVEVVRKVHADVVVIPREAVLEREIGPAAFVVKAGKAQLKSLVLGDSEGDRVVVKEGLAWDEEVVVKGGRDLIEGDLVRVTEVLQ